MRSRERKEKRLIKEIKKEEEKPKYFTRCKLVYIVMIVCRQYWRQPIQKAIRRYKKETR